ncbi:MAG TPA: hypothetical protein VIE88_09635, partial [Vicinamibacteria bacterium]
MKLRLVTTFLLSFASGLSAQETIVLKASRMIDPRRDAPIENAVVVVRGDRIEAAGAASAVAVPAGARTIELPGYTLLPGLMDCHVHITMMPGDGGDTQKLKETVAHDAIYGV